MRVLGIDPGLRLTGYGCIQWSVLGGEPALVEAGVLRLNITRPLAERLKQLHDDLGAMLDELAPDVLAVEGLFSMYRNPRTAILMAHARGVVLLQASLRGMSLVELTPTEVKKAVTGRGHASKAQVQRAVMAQCGLAGLPEPSDVADAIAVALCAGRRGGSIS